jgi:hypothetical protein
MGERLHRLPNISINAVTDVGLDEVSPTYRNCSYGYRKSAPPILRRFTVLIFLLLVTCHANAAVSVLSPRGYGSIYFGMKLHVAENTLGQPATPKYSGTGCSFVAFKKYPRLRFMIEDGIVTRADADKRVKNSAGILVGTALKKVKIKHPKAEIFPHEYDPEGHYVILNTNDNSAAILLEEGGGKITDIRAGLRAAVRYVEGCL